MSKAKVSTIRRSAMVVSLCVIFAGISKVSLAACSVGTTPAGYIPVWIQGTSCSEAYTDMFASTLSNDTLHVVAFGKDSSSRPQLTPNSSSNDNVAAGIYDVGQCNGANAGLSDPNFPASAMYGFFPMLIDGSNGKGSRYQVAAYTPSIASISPGSKLTNLTLAQETSADPQQLTPDGGTTELCGFKVFAQVN